MVLAPLLLLLAADSVAALPQPLASLPAPPVLTAESTRLPDAPPTPSRSAQPWLGQIRSVAQRASTGTAVVINGQRQQARWESRQSPAGSSELWLPLEVLQGQLGVSSRTIDGGTLDLEWYGRPLVVPAVDQRSLDDEVAVNVLPLLNAVGVQTRVVGDALHLELPPAALLGLRSSTPDGTRRVVLDLNAPALVRQEGSRLFVALEGSPDQLRQLAALGLQPRARRGGVELGVSAGTRLSKLFTLGTPHRLVVDLAGDGAAASSSGAPAAKPAPIDPRLQALLGRDLRWDRQTRTVAGRNLRINSVVMDPAASSLQLRTLTRSDGMQGLSSLSDLARQQDALVAINGGYFNRVRRLPLGALKEGGRWLSGPILNRGVMAWSGQQLPQFGRLQLQEWVIDANGRRTPLTVLNSGYVQRGLSRYTADWGAAYQALSGSESGALIQNGVVTQLFDGTALARSIPLPEGSSLLVARAGAPLPWSPGERLQIDSRPSSTLGQAGSVMGGGPLLLQNGRVVLNGTAEGFGDAFLRQGAPRTVVGSDGRRLWLVTLEGVDQAGPTLSETAWVLQQMGLRDALNLDGGSSTGLVMGGQHTVKGRGVAGSVHNGLGLVPGGRPMARIETAAP
ncbi:phosphodiester glycosidase family protein [Synechococcus sp. CBW1006]|uniref:phosphodiester glycosidase family protein n=1 Tax=Synechococcus sp. CBW1006 TaxID=1353138 RepID=UPI0018CF6D9A|nr:phosphodiester glycosidase family protein [Synechococcus sp. CBW1006]QPN67068.1 phosphodiester glycosidase family protein [Synechococcus sp. CBW1006]